MNFTVENDLFEVEKLLANQDYLDAKYLLESMLFEEPDYGVAHNYLGWLYYQKLNNLERADYHYRLAIKYSPFYPDPYINYLHLLNHSGRYLEALELADKARLIKGVPLDLIYNEKGKSYEMMVQYKKAIQSYSNAIKFCLKDELHFQYNNNIKRSKTKLDLFDRTPFFRKFFAAFF